MLPHRLRPLDYEVQSAKKQKPTLLRREDEHEAHHHGKRSLVEDVRRNVAQKCPARIEVCSVKTFAKDFPVNFIEEVFGIVRIDMPDVILLPSLLGIKQEVKSNIQ